MIKTGIGDGGGSGNVGRVSKHGALYVASSLPDLPPPGTKNRQRVFSEVTGSTGASSGTVNMNVDGSTDQEFYIGANQDAENPYDIYILSLVLIVADTAVLHNKFGNENALTTGIDVIVTEAGELSYLLKAIKTGGELIAHSGAVYAYGDGATVSEVINWSATTDAQVVTLPLWQYIPGGIRLGHSTKDKLSVWVRDNLTGLTEFTCRAFGCRIYD